VSALAFDDEDDTPYEVPIPPKKPVRIYWPDGTTSLITEQHDPPDFASAEWIARRKAMESACLNMAPRKDNLSMLRIVGKKKDKD
jgi:hypothetical protein